MAELHCPFCGTPNPDTGMRSAYGVGPPDGSPPEIPEGAWRQHTKCKGCGKPLVRNPASEISGLADWRANQSLMHFGGTSIVRSTDVPAGTPRIVEGSAHLSASGTLSATGEVVSGAASSRQVWIRRTEWDAAMTGVGALVGSPFGHGGMLLGGAVAYGWARWRWSED